MSKSWLLLGGAIGPEFLAVGEAGQLMTSDDGITWTVQTPISAANMFGLKRVGGTWYAEGNNARMYTSTDGVNFANTYALTPGSSQSIFHNGSYWIIPQTGISATYDKATDLAVLVSHTIPGFPANNIATYGVYWDGTQWLAGSSGGTDIASSPDGVTWTPSTMPAGTSIGTITKYGGLYVCSVNSGAAGIYTTDLLTNAWTQRLVPAAPGVLLSMASNGSILVAVGQSDGASAKIYSSPDALTWTLRASGIASSLANVAYNSRLGLFAAVASDGKVITSPDGITWTLRHAATGLFLSWVQALH